MDDLYSTRIAYNSDNSHANNCVALELICECKLPKPPGGGVALYYLILGILLCLFYPFVLVN